MLGEGIGVKQKSDSQDRYGEADIQGSEKPNKLKVCLDAIKFAWKQKVFKTWLIICTLGIVVGLLLGVGMTQLVLLVAVACIGWGLEIVNSAMEMLMDIVHPEYSPKVKVVKDAFAAVCVFVYSAYVISWLILVSPLLVRWIIKW